MQAESGDAIEESSSRRAADQCGSFIFKNSSRKGRQKEDDDQYAADAPGEALVKMKKAVIHLLTRIRNSRLLWETMGSIYNRRIYGALASLYDDVAGKIPLIPGAHLLDAGCGRGYIALQLAQKNPSAHVTGIDYSFMQVHEARKLQRIRKVINCRFDQGNVTDLGFADHSFAAAVSIGSIKHWLDPLRGLGEIRRVIKPGGLLVISETDQDVSDEDLWRFMTRFKVWFVPKRLLFWGLRHVIFGQSYTETTLSEALRQAGFQNIERSRVPGCPYVIAKARK
jgi:ubiquinone/menaquinone biosynthesis C-methylase UbiE